MFSLGLTILSSANLEDFEPLYDLKKFTLNSGVLANKKDDFRHNRAYSDILKATVLNLLSQHDADRIGPDELWSWIIPQEKHIMARENFVFPTAPVKIDQEFKRLREFHQVNAKPSLPGMV